MMNKQSDSRSRSIICGQIQIEFVSSPGLYPQRWASLSNLQRNLASLLSFKSVKASTFVINFDVTYCHLDMSKLSNAYSAVDHYEESNIPVSELSSSSVWWYSGWPFNIHTISFNFYVRSVFVTDTDTNTTHRFHINHNSHILMNKFFCNRDRVRF